MNSNLYQDDAREYFFKAITQMRAVQEQRRVAQEHLNSIYTRSVITEKVEKSKWIYYGITVHHPIHNPKK